MKRTLTFFLLVSFLALPACTLSESKAAGRAEARRAADAYLDSISLRDPGKQVSIEDQGATWLVVYHGPAGWAGGNRLVWVDKQTMEVIESVASQ